MNRKELAAVIDHTLLKPDATQNDIERLCREAIEYGFATACVNSIWVERAWKILEGKKPVVCSVVGFPLGASTSAPTEAEEAVENGAREIDMVLPVGFLKSGLYRMTENYISSVVDACSGVPVKVILETCLLSDEEKTRACRIAMNSGASWVKTSTGFSSGGAEASDVRLMKSVVGEKLGVKASGGIRTLQDAISMLDAGADRLGCSRSVQIIESLQE